MQNNTNAWFDTTRTRLDYLPPRASLVTSLANHSKKTMSTLSVQKQEVSALTVMQEVTAQLPEHKCAVPKLITSKN